MSYGEELKQRIIRIGIRQNDIANELGVSRQAVSLWIKNKTKPSRRTADRLEEFLREHESETQGKCYIRGCPLCGNDLSDNSRTILNDVCTEFWGYCNNCGASFEITKTDERDVIAKWNTREG